MGLQSNLSARRGPHSASPTLQQKEARQERSLQRSEYKLSIRKKDNGFSCQMINNVYSVIGLSGGFITAMKKYIENICCFFFFF